MRRVFRLTCNGCGCCDRSSFEMPPLGFDGWPACPEKLRRSPWWQYVVQLFNASLVSPLAGWPDAYAAWVPDALEHLRPAVERAAEDERKRAGNQPPGG